MRLAYLESKVLSADPVELVCLLYQEALCAVREARLHLAQGRIAERSAAISKAMAVLTELNASLDLEKGGEIGRNLARLYDFMQQRLLEANLKQAEEPLAEVLGLLATLAEAWEAIKPSGGAPGSAPDLPGRPSAAPAWANRFDDAARGDSRAWSA